MTLRDSQDSRGHDLVRLLISSTIIKDSFLGCRLGMGRGEKVGVDGLEKGLML